MSTCVYRHTLTRVQNLGGGPVENFFRNFRGGAVENFEKISGPLSKKYKVDFWRRKIDFKAQLSHFYLNFSTFFSFFPSFSLIFRNPPPVIFPRFSWPPFDFSQIWGGGGPPPQTPHVKRSQFNESIFALRRSNLVRNAWNLVSRGKIWRETR